MGTGQRQWSSRATFKIRLTAIGNPAERSVGVTARRVIHSRAAPGAAVGLVTITAGTFAVAGVPADQDVSGRVARGARPWAGLIDEVRHVFLVIRTCVRYCHGFGPPASRRHSERSGLVVVMPIRIELRVQHGSRPYGLRDVPCASEPASRPKPPRSHPCCSTTVPTRAQASLTPRGPLGPPRVNGRPPGTTHPTAA